MGTGSSAGYCPVHFGAQRFGGMILANADEIWVAQKKLEQNKSQLDDLEI